jgi:hypothetical protein
MKGAPMPKKILVSAAIVGVFAIVTTTSLLLRVGAHEQGMKAAGAVSVIDLERKLRDFREQTVDDPI